MAAAAAAPFCRAYSQNQELFAGLKTGDGEVLVFPAPVAVPEPSTWAMMLAGFTGLGALALSRKRKSTPA